MYASRFTTALYHLVQPGGNHTLCGLRVSRAMSGRRTNTLQLMHEVPLDLTICKHCQRIKGQDSWTGERISRKRVKASAGDEV